MNMKTNAEIIVDVLERAGIRFVFGYPGGQNARFLEALYGSKVEFVLVSHEACAGFMADVCGRLTGKPGVCLSTLGPGATNMATGVGNAYLDRVPLLAFTARMGRKWQGRTVQMQIDHRKLYAPITKWGAVLESGNVRSTLKKAMEVAREEQPGPVHLDLPEDFAEELSAEGTDDSSPSSCGFPAFKEESLRKAEALIRKAKYPLAAIGLGMNRAGATGELRNFISKHRLPVVCTLMAKGHVPETSPYFAGVLGRARRDVVAECIRESDLIIAFGYDPVELNYEEWVSPGVPLIHIDTVPADLDRGYPAPCDVIGNIREILDRLLAIPAARHSWDPEILNSHRRKLQEALRPARTKFSPHHAILAMREILPPDGILAADVGAHTHLIGQLWDPAGPGNLLVSNGWSSMGFGIPAAIAAKLIRPERPVMACTGDGGFLMTLGEINTAVRRKVPVVFVVLRDRFLSLIRVKQTRKEYHVHGVELFGSGYSSSDNFFGARVIVAEEEEAFRAALRQGLSGDKPLIIEAVVDPAEYDILI